MWWGWFMGVVRGESVEGDGVGEMERESTERKRVEGERIE
jgi:hypothetical protein